MKTRYALMAGFVALAGAALVHAFPSGGGFSVPASGMTSGGGVPGSGGGFRVTGSMGTVSVTQMNGGGFTMRPGIVASQRPSAVDLSNAHSYPNPFIPSQGHTHITFTSLPSRVTIRIFTLSGELIKTLIKDDATTDTVLWLPVLTQTGGSVASGVYLYHMNTSDGISATGKLMVIK